MKFFLTDEQATRLRAWLSLPAFDERPVRGRLRIRVTRAFLDHDGLEVDLQRDEIDELLWLFESWESDEEEEEPWPMKGREDSRGLRLRLVRQEERIRKLERRLERMGG